ncbi:hypothetical protein MW887_011295 [Aspergillus wentii]|nr:hypothetical protein MW887_011295 [Aspergillus wentii]
MSHFDESFFPGYEQPPGTGSYSDPEAGSDGFRSDNTINWAMISGLGNINAGQEELVTPHQDTFEGCMPLINTIIPAQMYSGVPLANGSEHGSSVAGNPADVDDFAVSSNSSAPGSSPPIFPGHFPFAENLAGDTSNNGSPIDPNHFEVPAYPHPGLPHEWNVPPAGGNYDGLPRNDLEGQSTNFDQTNQFVSHERPQPIHFNQFNQFTGYQHSNVAYASTAPPSIAACDGNQDFQQQETKEQPEPQEPQEPPVSKAGVSPIKFPTFAQLMDPDRYNVDTGTRFSSVHEANAASRNNEPPPYDPTIPETVKQHRAFVKTLCNAMKSIEYAEDNPGMIKPFADGKYPDQRIETVCWNLLDLCISRHTCGPLLAIFGIKSKQSGDLATFAQRVTKVIECLATICKHLLDPVYIYQFLDDPVAAQKRVIANKTLNKRKGAVMNAGKQALGDSGRPKSAASNTKSISIQDHLLEQPVVGPATSYSTPIKNTDSQERALTPDGLPRTIGSIRLNSSPVLDEKSASPVSQRMVTGTSSYHATPNLRQTVQTAGPNHQVFTPRSMPHSFPAQMHGRRMTAPTSHPRPDISFASAPSTPSHVRSGSGNICITPNGMMGNSIRNPYMAPVTPTRQSSNRRKRPTSEVDDLDECPSPEKKQR